MKHYDVERTGQMDFFDNYGIDYVNQPVLIDNTDGIVNGNIIEFKLNISNLGKVLFQAIKYLSAMRIRGESVPATILLVDLNSETAYQFSSKKYQPEIEKIYIGSASKSDDNFAKQVKPDIIYHYNQMLDSDKLKKQLINSVTNDSNRYLAVNLDENCIVGWAKRYYREMPKATKGDFLGDDSGKVKIVGEIREPRHFKGLILPYKKPTNEKFKYLMDCLNDDLHKKDLGAFYTPAPYAKKAAELVAEAVNRVPEGNDYIILDRCAGSGALERGLLGLKDKNGEELISHAVVSTIEYYEYKVLLEDLGNKVRNIIPPTENNIEYESGLIRNADAMSKEYINNLIIKQYIDNPKCSIILFENPPYRDQISNNVNKRENSISQHFVQQELKKILPNLPNSNISTARDLSNQFIWSGYHYYLRQPTDSYILFSPVKYWKVLGLANYQFINGFLFNRHWFHATPSAIACIEWQYQKSNNSTIKLVAYDIDKRSFNLVQPLKKKVTISKVHKTFKEWFDKKVIDSDVETPVFCERNGEQAFNRKCDGKSYYNKNLIGYLQTAGFNINPNNVCLTRMTNYDNRGFYLRSNKYLNFLPLFLAKEFPQKKWYERDIYATTSDGGTAYTHDTAFLQHCLLYTCLSNQNKCLSFTGSDGRYYRNELCFDSTNGNTQALSDLNTDAFTKQEIDLYNLWTDLISEAKKTPNYNPKLTYGVYQITKELDTFHFEGSGYRKKKVYDDPLLHGYLTSLRNQLKDYYLAVIKPDMFKYQLIK